MDVEKSDWFFLGETGEQHGPMSRDALFARWREGVVGAGTLVWAPGMGAWARFDQAFAEQIPPAPPVGRAPPTVEATGHRPVDRVAIAASPAAVDLPAAWVTSDSRSTKTNGGATTPAETRMSMGLHPWRRLFANFTDLAIFSGGSFLILGSTLSVQSPETLLRFSQGFVHPLFGGVITVFMWALWGSLFLTVLGTTPARALYGIQIRKLDGTRVSGEQALNRSFLVATKGLGLGIPLIVIFTQIAGYVSLKRDGQSTWDADVGTRVTHTVWSPLRAISVVVVTLLATSVFFAAAFIAGAAAVPG
jgi:hypothetical protein